MTDAPAGRPWWQMPPDEFKRTFDPQPGTDYGWVSRYAEAEYARAVEMFRRADDKAAAVANYLGAGAGALMLGAVAGLAGDRVDRWVLLAAVPALVAALVALAVAVYSRVTMPRWAPPSVAAAVGYAEFYPEKGEAAYLGVWHGVVEKMHAAVARKQRRTDRALLLFVAAVGLLALPLLVGLIRRFA